MEHIIDASNKVLGRLASQIAHILQGKTHPAYEPRLAGKDRVIIKNASRIVITGRKREQKIYYRHTGYIGHLKSFTYEQMFKKSPEWVLREAVQRMLPKNRLRPDRMKRLIVEK